MRRAARVLVALGSSTVLAGVAVLLSRPSREAGFGWFAYAPPSQDDLDGLVAINGARVLGVGLVVAGLAVLLLTLGLVRGVRGRTADARRPLVGLVVVGGLAVLVGLVGLAVPRRMVVVSELLPTGWTAGQVADAGLAALGLLVLTLCAGVALGRRAR